MFGSSAWENVPDVLHMYGMCSYRDWFELKEFTKPTDDKRKNLGKCSLNSNQCASASASNVRISRWWDTSLPYDQQDFPTIWDSGRFRVHPHLCDIDYMHLEGLKGCRPVLDSAVVNTFNVISTILDPGSANLRSVYSARTGSLARTIKDDYYIQLNPTSLSVSPLYTKAGFLSVDNNFKIEEDTFLDCLSQPQCFIHPFTAYGELAIREVPTGFTLPLRPWIQREQELCGIFGYLVNIADAQKSSGLVLCALDPAVTHLYQLLCRHRTNSSVVHLISVCPQTKQLGFKIGDIVAACSMPNTYQMSVVQSVGDVKNRSNVLQEIGNRLNGLYNVFGSADLQQDTEGASAYLQVMHCSEALFSALQDLSTNLNKVSFKTKYQQTHVVSLYYQLRYTQEEIPYTWWHDCMLLPYRPFPTFGEKQIIVQCQRWAERLTLASVTTAGSAAIQWQSIGARDTLLRVDAGLTTSDVQGLQTATGPELLRRYMYDYRPGPAAEFRPRCFRHIRWLTYSELGFDLDQYNLCMQQLAVWTLEYSAASGKFNTVEGLYNSRTGIVGIPSVCYKTHEDDLMGTPTGDDLLQGTMLDKGGLRDTILSSTYTEVDFLNAGLDFTVQDGKLPLVELDVPDFSANTVETLQALQGLQNNMMYTNAASAILAPTSVLYNSANRAQYQTDNRQQIPLPCVTPSQLNGMRPGFSNDYIYDCALKLEPTQTILTRDWCASRKTAMTGAITEFSKPRQGVWRYKWVLRTPTGEYVNHGYTSERAHPHGLHAGVSEYTLGLYTSVIDNWATTCESNADSGLYYTSTVQPGLPSYDDVFKVADGFGVLHEDSLQQSWEECSKSAICANSWEQQTVTGSKVVDYVWYYTYQMYNMEHRMSMFQYIMPFVVEVWTKQERAYSRLNPWHHWTYHSYQESVFESILAYTGAHYNLHRKEPTLCYEDPTGRVLGDEYFLTPASPGVNPWNRCLAVGVLIGSGGSLGCKFHPDDGLRALVTSTQELVAQGNGVWKTALTKTEKWSVNPNLLITDATKTTDDVARLLYTMYVQIAYKLQNHADYHSLWLAPRVFDLFTKSSLMWSAQYPYEGFNVDQQRQLEDAVDEAGQSCGTNDVSIKYSQCANNSDYIKGIDEASIEFGYHHRIDGPVVIPAGRVLMWGGLSAKQHSMRPHLPAWAAADRKARDVFARWILNRNTQCEHATVNHAICTIRAGSLELVNPWMGGDFNAFRGCDTVQSSRNQDGDWDVEAVDVSCPTYICKDKQNSTYFTEYPNAKCKVASENGRTPSKRNIQPSAGTNICYYQPTENTTCTARQGTLYRTREFDVPVSTVYDTHSHRHADARISPLGMGLFVHGGNPLYRDEQPDPDLLAGVVDPHPILWMHPSDLGGHHMVIKVYTHPITLESYMRVDRTPLIRLGNGQLYGIPYGSDGTVAGDAYVHSRKARSTHDVSSGWLYNLRVQMKEEEFSFKADELYPKSAGDPLIQPHWSCPFRRISFWTTVVSNGFSPLVPSPVRSARLFGVESGLGMTHSTRMHPIMVTAPLTRLATVYTSNGFCFCTTPANCQIQMKDKTHLCGLQQTVNSLHDQQWRSITNLDTGKCEDQLDWPFENGTTRDGYTMKSRNSQSAKCNVLPRYVSRVSFIYEFCKFIK